MDSIGDYYDRKRREKDAAREALDTARRNGAAADVIRRLEKAYERAAYVGD